MDAVHAILRHQANLRRTHDELDDTVRNLLGVVQNHLVLAHHRRAHEALMGSIVYLRGLRPDEEAERVPTLLDEELVDVTVPQRPIHLDGTVPRRPTNVQSSSSSSSALSSSPSLEYVSAPPSPRQQLVNDLNREITMPH